MLDHARPGRKPAARNARNAVELSFCRPETAIKFMDPSADHGAGRRESGPQAHLNAIGTAVPAHDVHEAFLAYVRRRAMPERSTMRSNIHLARRSCSDVRT